MAKPFIPSVKPGSYMANPRKGYIPFVGRGGYTKQNHVWPPEPDPIWESVTGNPVSFETIKQWPLKHLSVAFSPKQDLHGYDSPWPAGGGKNLSHLYDADLGHGSLVKDQTDNAVTVYNITENTSYKYASYKALDLTGLGGQTLAFSCKVTVIAGDDTPRVIGAFYTESGRIGSNIFEKTGTSLQATVTVPSDIPDGAWLRLTFYSSSNKAGAQEIRYYDIQVEAGSTATSYAPYSNLCPISGWDSLTVEQRGVNVWDEVWEVGIINADGTVTTGSGTRIVSKNFIPVVSGKSYCMVWPARDIRGRGAYYDENYNLVEYKGDFPDNRTVGDVSYGTFTVPSTARYLKFCTTATYGSTYNHDISINYPSTDTSYHAYNPLSRSISINLGSTVYSGVLDVVTGVGEVTMASVDLGTLAYSYSTTYNRFVSVIGALTDAYNSGNNTATTIANILCDHYAPTTNANGYNGTVDNSIALAFYNGEPKVLITDHQYTDPDAFKTAMSGTKLCYQLKTPIPIQLTPQEVQSLAGDNTMWSNANQPITVEYRKN